MVRGDGVELHGHQRRAIAYSILMLIDGIPHSVCYKIKEKDHQRLQELLFERGEGQNEQPFFNFHSLDGFYVAASVADVQMANFLFDAVLAGDVEYQRRDLEIDDVAIEIYFRGRSEPYRVLPAEPTEMPTVFMAFDDVDFRAGRVFESFMDVDGEPVYFQPGQVVLIVIPDEFIDFEAEE